MDCREFPTLHASKNCVYPGFMVEILNDLASHMNITLEPVIEDVDLKQSLLRKALIDKEGKPNGELQYLYNGTVDLIASPFQITNHRLKWFDFSREMYHTDTSMIVSKDLTLSNNVWSFFGTYSSSTWLAILTALILQIISSWQMLRLQLMQPEKIYFKSLAGRVSILLFSLVQCAVLLGVFSTWILSSIITETIETPIEKIEVLIKRVRDGQLTMIAARPETWFYEKISQSDEYIYKEIRLALERNPLRYINTTDTTMRKVSTGNFVSFVQDDEDTKFATLTYCNIMEITVEMPTVTGHLLFRKNHPLLPLFNQAITENQAHILRIINKYKNLSRKLKNQYCTRSLAPTPLRILPYCGLFIVCSVVIAVSCVILLMEAYVTEVRHRRQGKVFKYGWLVRIVKFLV
ncbi:unnamed protein product [Bursaphelenchus okinawaensis]|uniref:Solute-binding protein family 3/N-terminal domain-containing protein n=1 Tax=Bursaphelenchus okinawaensis TaxID=465554 RepID=A0A811K822_9BILA|nr:unnamed protein product [Bursaphelenchus okinawaensis]CAG9092835.1 unnamed protein product [Bursaphelenchus okinawaensis]